MSAVGRVMIDLGHGMPPRVRFDQPGEIVRLLAGRPPAQAANLLPRVYTVCATAQAHAGCLALERASGINAGPCTETARAALTTMEALREHLLRITLDWPGFVDCAAEARRAAPAMTLVQRMEAALFAGDGFALGARAEIDETAAMALIDEAEALLCALVYGMGTAQWLDKIGTMRAFDQWRRSTHTMAAGFMRSLAGEEGMAAATPAMPLAGLPDGRIRDWLVATNADAILVRGDGGAAPETTAYARHAEHPLIAALGDGLSARHAARLVDLAGLPDRLRALVRGDDTALMTIHGGGDGFGWARVDVSRGALIHAVLLDQGVVAHYRILPPTRWNFDQRGVAARCLATLCTGDDAALGADDAPALERRARLAVQAIDPCVGVEMRVH